jgi:hypothetical protein
MCIGRRPEDPPVWRARLDWAVKSHRPDEAWEAMKHIPAEENSPALLHRLAARMAAATGDVERERRELASVVTEEPEDFETLDRLISLERRAPGDADTVPGSGQKAETERARDRYRELYRRNQPSRDAEELARIGTRLGHRFEAAVFLSAALADDPGRVDLREALYRLEKSPQLTSVEGRTLFDVVADESGEGRPMQASPARRPASG